MIRIDTPDYYLQECEFYASLGDDTLLRFQQGLVRLQQCQCPDGLLLVWKDYYANCFQWAALERASDSRARIAGGLIFHADDHSFSVHT